MNQHLATRISLTREHLQWWTYLIVKCSTLILCRSAHLPNSGVVHATHFKQSCDQRATFTLLIQIHERKKLHLCHFMKLRRPLMNAEPQPLDPSLIVLLLCENLEMSLCESSDTRVKGRGYNFRSGYVQGIHKNLHTTNLWSFIPQQYLSPIGSASYKRMSKSTMLVCSSLISGTRVGQPYKEYSCHHDEHVARHLEVKFVNFLEECANAVLIACIV